MEPQPAGQVLLHVSPESTPGRQKRKIRPPKRFDDEHGAQVSNDAKCLRVRRPLTEADVTGALAKREVCVLWPPDGLWYNAVVKKVKVKEQKADVLYTDTEEKEEIKLNDLIEAKEISIVELRQPPLTLASDESILEGPSVLVNDTPFGNSSSEAAPKPSPAGHLTPVAAMANQHTFVNPEQDSQEPAVTAETVDSGGDVHVAVSESQLSEVMWDADQDLAAEEWTKELLAGIIVPNDSPEKEVSAEPIPGSGLVRQGSSLPTSVTTESVRSKATSNFCNSLMKAASEANVLHEADTALATVQLLAESVETELFSLYGVVGKEYKAKYRSLNFNLKDPQNPQLRGRVFAGELSAKDLVQMSALQLASKELSEWRTKKAAEFEKAVILDVKTAAKYSTAAAAELKMGATGDGEGTSQSRNELTADVPSRHDDVQISSPQRESGVQHTGAAKDNDNRGLDDSETTDVLGVPAGATAVGSSGGAKSPTHLGMDNGRNYDSAAHHVASPGNAPRVSGSPSLSESANSSVIDIEDFGTVVSSKQLKDSGEYIMGWDGVLNAPGIGKVSVSIDQWAGIGDLGLLIPQKTVEIKGRVGNDKLENFFSDLRSSRSRTVSLGIVRCHADNEDVVMKELVYQYASKGRAGVAEPEKGLELYFIPRSILSARLCETARQLSFSEGIPRNVDRGELLCACIHRKDWEALPQAAPKSIRVGNAARTAGDGHGFSPPRRTAFTLNEQPPDETASSSELPAFLQPRQHADVYSITEGSQGPIDNAKECTGLDLRNLGDLAAALGVNLLT